MIVKIIGAFILAVMSIIVVTQNNISFSGNQCAPSLQVNGSCINLVSGWGWPKAIVVDNAAISTLGSLGTDDKILLANVIINAIFFYGLISFAEALIRYIRRFVE